MQLWCVPALGLYYIYPYYVWVLKKPYAHAHTKFYQCNICGFATVYGARKMQWDMHIMCVCGMVPHAMLFRIFIHNRHTLTHRNHQPLTILSSSSTYLVYLFSPCILHHITHFSLCNSHCIRMVSHHIHYYNISTRYIIHSICMDGLDIRVQIPSPYSMLIWLLYTST
jgi:hypothetical protein